MAEFLHAISLQVLEDKESPYHIDDLEEKFRIAAEATIGGDGEELIVQPRVNNYARGEFAVTPVTEAMLPHLAVERGGWIGVAAFDRKDVVAEGTSAVRVKRLEVVQIFPYCPDRGSLHDNTTVNILGNLGMPLEDGEEQRRQAHAVKLRSGLAVTSPEHIGLSPHCELPFTRSSSYRREALTVAYSFRHESGQLIFELPTPQQRTVRFARM